MADKSVRDAILSLVGHTPTQGQEKLAELLEAFVDRSNPNRIFILRGYAGTGKTTIISSLVKALFEKGIECILLAPTGRAAKVLAGYSGFKAFTIHKKIYWLSTQSDGTVGLRLQTNKHKNAIFVVDEASMIASARSDQGDLFGNANLLDDLLEYIEQGTNCKIILTGDTAQLPPVFSLQSPALSPKYLSERYSLKVSGFVLTEVVRQALESGILTNATIIRNLLEKKTHSFPNLLTKGYNDFVRLEGSEVADAINEAFMGSNLHNSLIICRSNKRANLYNKMLRNRVLFREEELSSGDLLMVVKNNYFWLPEESNAGFIANGDIAQIRRVRSFEERFGFRFAELSIQLLDYPEEPELEVKVLLNTIDAESPSLSASDSKRLYDGVAAEFEHVSKKSLKTQLIKSSPYLNALQVKFAYSLTCHKAQGGQWDNVFVELGIAQDSTPDEGLLRWIYTAFTRATGKLYLLNFSDQFFSNRQPDSLS